MMKIVLLSALMLTGGLVLVPQASAECVPLLDQDFCGERILPRECTWHSDPDRIECEW